MILDEIVKNKRAELERQKKALPSAEIQRRALGQPPAKNLAAALTGKGIHLIAEVKKASPSRGLIRADFDPRQIAGIYAANGAAAISVLTETRYFQGRLDHLTAIRDTLGAGRPPLLRKDFIFDPYQIYESRAAGADALLLIAAILTPGALAALLDLSRRLGMQCLVETHNETEVRQALASNAYILGINNRDLQTLAVDINTTTRLRPLIPADRMVVSESGIRSHADVEKLQASGVNAILVGETLMTAPDTAVKMRELQG